MDLNMDYWLLVPIFFWKYPSLLYIFYCNLDKSTTEYHSEEDMLGVVAQALGWFALVSSYLQL